jgi:hypothetical protein
VDDRLWLSVTHTDGTLTRWGYDEPDPANVLDDLTFGTSTPGGFRDLGCGLLRDLVRANPDQRLFTDVTAKGPGGRIAWEGRLTQFPYADGVIRPGAVGWGAHLKDDPSLVEVYVDRDPQHFEQPPLARRQALATGGFQQGKIPANVGDVGGLSWTVPNESIPTNENDEAWYTMPAGCAVAVLGYKGSRTGAFTGFEAPFVFTTANDAFSSTAGNAALTLDGTARHAVLSAAARYAVLRLNVSAGPVTPSAHLQAYTLLGVYGTHGLTRRAVAGDLDGFYVPDMVRNIVQRWAPMLTIGDIDADTFVCPHAASPTRPTPRPRSATSTRSCSGTGWSTTTRPSATPRPIPTGSPGRPGATAAQGSASPAMTPSSNSTASSSATRTRSAASGSSARPPPTGRAAPPRPTPPARCSSTPARRTRSTRAASPAAGAKLELSFPTTDDAAAQIGAVWLLEHAQAQRRGTITLQGIGSVQHPTQGDLPTWCVRAGDYISVGDAANDVPRRIISTTYTHRDRTLTADLDNTPQKLDAILERIGVNFVGVL